MPPPARARELRRALDPGAAGAPAARAGGARLVAPRKAVLSPAERRDGDGTPAARGARAPLGRARARASGGGEDRRVIASTLRLAALMLLAALAGLAAAP